MRAFDVRLNVDGDYYMIAIGEGYDLFKFKGYHYTSSYHVLNARLLGLSYPDYLHYCQSMGAILKGKTGYCYPVWKEKKDCKKVADLIEKQWNIFLSEVSFEGWE